MPLMKGAALQKMRVRTDRMTEVNPRLPTCRNCISEGRSEEKKCGAHTTGNLRPHTVDCEGGRNNAALLCVPMYRRYRVDLLLGHVERRCNFDREWDDYSEEHQAKASSINLRIQGMAASESIQARALFGHQTAFRKSHTFAIRSARKDLQGVPD